MNTDEKSVTTPKTTPVAKAAVLKYVGPQPAKRIGNLPGVLGTRAADQLTQEQIAYVIATSPVPAVASWWTPE